MNKMSVTRALAELKRTDEQIQRAQSGKSFVAVTVGKDNRQKVLNASAPVATVKSDIQSAFDTIQALYEKRAKLKAALVQSNAVTKVNIAGAEVTVAEAIEMKRSIQSKRDFVQVLKAQLTNANAVVAKTNATMEAQIDAHIATIYGNDKGKAEAAMVDAIAKPQRDQKEAALLDPMNIAKVIEQLENEISLVDTELDFTLSEVNAKTEISI